MNKRSARLATVFAIVFIDLLGFGLILPLLPFFAEKFGASPTTIGFIVASYAIAQFIGTPILGRLSDRYGRRPLLLISIMGAGIGFLLLGLAHSLLLIFASRIIAGLFGGNISVAQAYITDITTEENRAKGLGLIGAAFGLGFIVGPAVGGLLSVYGFDVPAFLAAGLCLLNVLAVTLWLGESLPPEKRKIRNPEEDRLRSVNVKVLWEAMHHPRTGSLLYVRFFYGLAFSTFTSVFALFAEYRLHLTEQTVGYILAYVGVLISFVQGFLIGKLSQRFREIDLIVYASVVLAVGLGAWALAPSIPLLVLSQIPIAFGGGILNTSVNSALTKTVPPQEFGGILGISASLESLTRVFAPMIGGLMLQHFGTSAPGIFGAVIMIGIFFFVQMKMLRANTTGNYNPKPLDTDTQDFQE